MKSQKGFTVAEVVVFVLILTIAVGWVMNIVKLARCDFDAPYKAEAMHAIGLFIPPVAAVTGWMDFGE